jgi:hypothetical protein
MASERRRKTNRANVAGAARRGGGSCERGEPGKGESDAKKSGLAQEVRGRVSTTTTCRSRDAATLPTGGGQLAAHPPSMEIGAPVIETA